MTNPPLSFTPARGEEFDELARMLGNLFHGAFAELDGSAGRWRGRRGQATGGTVG